MTADNATQATEIMTNITGSTAWNSEKMPQVTEMMAEAVGHKKSEMVGHCIQFF